MATDPHVAAVQTKLDARARAGLQKYGTDLTRTDLTTLDWLRHAQEEALDCALYLERLIQDEERSRRNENLPR